MHVSKLVGQGSVFEHGGHVPVTHMQYFKPSRSAFSSDLRAKDRRSAKECEYINGAGDWLETELAAPELVRAQGRDVKEVAGTFSIEEESLKVAVEVA